MNRTVRSLNIHNGKAHTTLGMEVVGTTAFLRPLHTAAWREGISLWYETDLDGPSNTLTVWVRDTGGDVPERGVYVGTVLEKETFAWHIYAAIR